MKDFKKILLALCLTVCSIFVATKTSDANIWGPYTVVGSGVTPTEAEADAELEKAEVVMELMGEIPPEFVGTVEVVDLARGMVSVNDYKITFMLVFTSTAPPMPPIPPMPPLPPTTNNPTGLPPTPHPDTPPIV